MKVGSKVEKIKVTDWETGFMEVWPICPKFNTIYTIRGIHVGRTKKLSLTFEEIVNKNLPFVDAEPSFTISDFRELTYFSEVMEFVEENTGELV